ncbi:MAG: hypothetical protein RLZZ442_1503 [Cyanobacteriota bacterium]
MQWPRSRARKNGASPQPNTGNQLPGHRSRGRATMPTTTPPASERRAAAAGRCTPRHSRGTLKDGRRRPEPCGARSAQRQGRPTPSIEQLLARQLLDAQSSSLPRSEGPETPNLLTFLLTPKAAGRKTSAIASILGFYNQSLLSSRSLVRIQQGAFESAAGTQHQPHHQQQAGGANGSENPICVRSPGHRASLPEPQRSTRDQKLQRPPKTSRTRPTKLSWRSTPCQSSMRAASSSQLPRCSAAYR